MNKSDSIKELATALAAFQAEMPAVKMNSVNPFLKNKYADLGAMIETAQPVLAKHGLSVTQLVTSDNALIGIETALIHNSGEWISSTVTMFVGDEKGKSLAQVAGSTITYMRRYSFSAILGLYADEDTDGSHTTAPQQQKPKQAPTTAEVKQPANGNGKKAEAPTMKAWATWAELSKGAKAKGIEVEEPLAGITADELAIKGRALRALVEA